MQIIRRVLQSTSEVVQVIKDFESIQVIAAAFDTEANGLHIIKCRPFLFQFGWLTETELHAYLIDLRTLTSATTLIAMWHKAVVKAPRYIAHNVKFDLHMLKNLGIDYREDNITDSMFYIRFSQDNIPVRSGGTLLGLKPFVKKHINPNADKYDKQVQAERSAIAKRLNQALLKLLGGTAKSWDAFFKDATHTLDDMTPDARLAYTHWNDSLPEDITHGFGRLSTDDIPYNMVSNEVMYPYALEDIVDVLLVYKHCTPIIEARQTQIGLKLEEESIYPFFDMERVGFGIDQDYVKQSYTRMKAYILKRRQDLKDLTGLDITANQHAVLLQYLNNCGLSLEGTGADALNRALLDYPNHPALHTIVCVQELRTLEKWFSTYLTRFLGEDRIYTQINQVGAASLRISSDFQQFPKGGCTTLEGEELFNPRRAILAGSQGNTVYIDYSQVELRVQAIYTILLGKPDLNLCRAFMPFNCYERDGKWYHNEDHLEWHPIDLHSATTKEAFGIDESHPDFKKLRSVGKQVNFAKNYGATRKQIKIMFPDYDEATITRIDSAYYRAFPNILEYHNFCERLAAEQAYATNLFGIRYWNVSGHNLKNMLVQGSSATFLKIKTNAVDKYLKDNGFKTQLIMPIHDEIQFDMPDDELHIIPILVKIMEDMDDWCIPIVADVEITKTYWSEKEDMK